MGSTPLHGGCFCGAVRYRAQAAPTWSMVCHCRTCRRVAGAPVVAWVTFAVQDLEFVAGQPRSFASSEAVRRTFCGQCGTQLTYAHAAEPQSVDVATCTLDAPEQCPPSHHSWLEDDLPWVRFGDGLPAYARSRSGHSG